MKLKDEAIEVARAIYAHLGAGYDENIYHSAFEVEMRLRGINYESEKPVQVSYKDHYVAVLYADIFIWRGDEKVLIEFKAGTTLLSKAQKAPERIKEIAQVAGYYKQLNLPTDTPALLINFPFPAKPGPDIIEIH